MSIHLHRCAIALIVALACLVAAPTAHANGVLLTGSGAGDASATPRLVTLKEHRVTAVIRDQVAEVTVEQTFFNHSSRQLEGNYLFPLPEGAVVSEFAMTMMGTMVQGEVLEAKAARRIYESIVRRQRDPGLLEYVGRGLFRARVFPIEANKPLTIKLTFQQVLLDDAGTLEMRYPLATDRMNGASVDRVVMDFSVTSSIDLKAIYSPSHKFDVARTGEREARLTFESAGQRQTRDILLYLGRSPDAVGISMLSAKGPGEDGTFMAVLAPPQSAADGQRVAKDIVFVLDTSGSMEGEKIDQARRALAYGVRTLMAEDRFNVLSFSTAVRPFRDGLIPATRDAREAAAAWIDGLQASGGTNIEAALTAALRTARVERSLDIVFITDGKPTVGTQDATALERLVTRKEGPTARIYTFGVGYDLDVALLDRLADATHGTRDYVAPDEDLEIVTSRFFRKVKQPVFRDVTIDLGPGVYDVYPSKIDDLFAGTQVVVFGRYREPGARTIELRGLLGTRRTTLGAAATLVAEGGPEYLQRLWANRKVAYLLDELRLRGTNQELVDEVVRLATKHSIVTPYTSGLVVEDRELADAVE
ncbi:MAG: VIT domain-containing protein, partial [Planctomycetota bacterium]|nr:VIT domain-containing protein [Planctomycetota bacterium]